MTLEHDPEFDAYLDDIHKPVTLPFSAVGWKPSTLLHDLDPVQYEDLRADWLERQLARTLGDGVLDQYRVNGERFGRLSALVSRGRVVPFVGAGISASCGFPAWTAFLQLLAKQCSFPKMKLKKLLANGSYEEAATQLADNLGEPAFREAFDRVFDPRAFEVSPWVADLFALCAGPAITTNYDRVIEAAASPQFKQIFLGRNPGEFARLAREGDRVLLKVHGELYVPESRVLTSEDYDYAYGSGEVPDIERVLPRTLRSVFLGHTILFLGCSLTSDRTMTLLRHLVESDRDGGSMCHFALVATSKSRSQQKKRERFLSDCCIFPIWYENTPDHAAVPALIGHLRRLAKEG